MKDSDLQKYTCYRSAVLCSGLTKKQKRTLLMASLLSQFRAESKVEAAGVGCWPSLSLDALETLNWNRREVIEFTKLMPCEAPPELGDLLAFSAAQYLTPITLGAAVQAFTRLPPCAEGETASATLLLASSPRKAKVLAISAAPQVPAPGGSTEPCPMRIEVQLRAYRIMTSFWALHENLQAVVGDVLDDYVTDLKDQA